MDAQHDKDEQMGNAATFGSTPKINLFSSKTGPCMYDSTCIKNSAYLAEDWMMTGKKSGLG